MKCNPWVGGSIGRRGFPMLGTGKRGLSTYVKQLFSNGEQGFFYDPNDLSTMYQDAAGTVPVTAVGQPVGLLLDKSNGLGLEHILTSSNDFTLSSGKWAKGSNVQFSLNPTSGAAQLTFIGGHFDSNNHFSYGGLRSNLREMFEISFDAKHISGADMVVGLGYGGARTVSATENMGVVRRYSFKIFNNAGGLNRAIIFSGSSSKEAIWEISNVSTAQVRGNHAYQTTSASRPILRKNAVTGANYLEFDGSDDFLQTSNIDFTATDKVSLFAGVRKLSDANTAFVVESSVKVDFNVGAFNLAAPSSMGSVKFSSDLGYGTSFIRAANTETKYSAPISAVLTSHLQRTATLKSVKLRINSALGAQIQGEPNGSGMGNYPLFIGRRGGVELPFTGNIYSLIGISRLTTDAETLALEKAIAKQTGVTLNV